MFTPHHPDRTDASTDAISQAAARWVVLRDRGLTGQEVGEFERWLAADPRHGEAIERSSQTWDRLGWLPAELAVPAGRSATEPRFSPFVIGALAVAAAVAVVCVGWRQMERLKAPGTMLAVNSGAAPRVMMLTDGTLVRLNVGGEVAERFTPAEREVVLLRGEAHFNVKKNAAWPFVVRAGTAEVVAVGTAFDVDFQSKQVEVVVTEGKVKVAANVSDGDKFPAMASQDGSLVKAGQQAVISRVFFFRPWTVAVSESDPENLARIIAWEDPLMRLTGATLGDLAADFQRRTGYRLILADPEIAALRIGGRFRLDDVDDFVRLLAENYGLEAQQIGQNETVLRLRK